MGSSRSINGHAMNVEEAEVTVCIQALPDLLHLRGESRGQEEILLVKSLLANGVDDSPELLRDG